MSLSPRPGSDFSRGRTVPLALLAAVKSVHKAICLVTACTKRYVTPDRRAGVAVTGILWRHSDLRQSAGNGRRAAELVPAGLSLARK